jgi:CheY-like chemotaxis protein
MMLDRLRGCRVLVVEDEMLIAMMIEDTLQELGCTVVGPVGKLDAALQLATHEPLDAAVLDISIRGGLVYPVAEALLARNVGFVFASGYGNWALPEIFANQLRLAKPFTLLELEETLRLLVNRPVAAA